MHYVNDSPYKHRSTNQCVGCGTTGEKDENCEIPNVELLMFCMGQHGGEY